MYDLILTCCIHEAKEQQGEQINVYPTTFIYILLFTTMYYFCIRVLSRRRYQLRYASNVTNPSQ